jgi:hypothetical protein
MYAVLSAHAHGSPLSFYRVDKENITSAAIASDFQFGTVGLVLEYVTGALHLACMRMFDLYPERFLKIKHPN